MRTETTSSAYGAYQRAHRLVQSLGLSKLLRRSLGPWIGRYAYRRAAPDNGPRMLHGHRMHLAPAGAYPPLAMLADRYEESTTRLLESALRPGMRVVDVGAHVGYYTLLAARCVGPTGRVYAFEPEPGNYGLLQANVALNAYAHVEAFPDAVADAIGESAMFLSGLDSGRHSFYRNGVTSGRRVPVRIVTLDAVLERLGHPAIDLVKIDVEGGEPRVLQGMGALLARGLPRLLIELAPCELAAAGATPQALMDRLRALGFRIQAVGPAGPAPLADGELAPLVARLTKEGSSVNLWCER